MSVIYMLVLDILGGWSWALYIFKDTFLFKADVSIYNLLVEQMCSVDKIKDYLTNDISSDIGFIVQYTCMYTKYILDNNNIQIKKEKIKEK